MHIEKAANEILGKPEFKIVAQATEINLVVVSVGELGFKEASTEIQEIFKKAQELGLKLCPAEVGPQLRLQYPQQPKEEMLLVAMEPIPATEGRLAIFVVTRSGDNLWLRSIAGRPTSRCPIDLEFVFIIPGKK